MLFTLGAQEGDFHQGSHQQMLGEMKDTPKTRGPRGQPRLPAPPNPSPVKECVQLGPELFCRFAETPLFHTHSEMS